VMVWDMGTYHPEGNNDRAKDNALMKKQVAAGNIKVVLAGEKLKGSYHLIEMKGEERQWLLMKGKEQYADKKEFKQLSVLTGRDLDEIAQGNHVWRSNRAKSAAYKKEKKVPKSEQLSSGVSDAAFTAEDLADAKSVKEFPYDWRPQLATLANE